MAMIKDLLTVMSTGEAHHRMEVALQLEILSGCDHHCPGCHVPRKNPYVGEDLTELLRLATELEEQGITLHEVVLAPTDPFVADNTEEVLGDPTFQALVGLNLNTRITSTAMFEGLTDEDFFRLFNILNDPSKYRPDLPMEMIIPVNIPKAMAGDLAYDSELRRFVNLITHHTEKVVDFSLAVNIDNYTDLDYGGFAKLSKIVNERYGTILELQPSFARTGKLHIIEKKIEEWKQMFVNNIRCKEDAQTVTFTSASPVHAAFHILNLCYRSGSLYVSPFLYEQIVLARDRFKIPEFTAESVLTKVQELTAEQYAYAAKTKNCSECPYLNTCVTRNVLAFMEEFDMVECPLPHDILIKYYDTSHELI